MTFAMHDALGSAEFVVSAFFALVVAGILGSVGVVKAWTTLKVAIAQLQDQSGQTLHQVKNDHASNLRDDVDRMTAAIEGQSRKIDTIREQVAKLDERDRKQQDTALSIYTRLGQLASADSEIHRRIDQLQDH